MFILFQVSLHSISNNVKVKSWNLWKNIRFIESSRQTADGEITVHNEGDNRSGIGSSLFSSISNRHLAFYLYLSLVNRMLSCLHMFSVTPPPHALRHQQIEKKFCGSTLLSAAADPHGSSPALSRKGSGSRGQCSIRPLLGGSRASMRPSVEWVTLSERTGVHILSLDSNTFIIPSRGKKEKKS